MKIFKGLSNSKNMVSSVIKLLNDSMDLNLGKGADRSDPSGMSGISFVFRLPVSGYRWQTGQR
jgi:hypothetical protein